MRRVLGLILIIILSLLISSCNKDKSDGMTDILDSSIPLADGHFGEEESISDLIYRVTVSDDGLVTVMKNGEKTTEFHLASLLKDGYENYNIYQISGSQDNYVTSEIIILSIIIHKEDNITETAYIFYDLEELVPIEEVEGIGSLDFASYGNYHLFEVGSAFMIMPSYRDVENKKSLLIGSDSVGDASFQLLSGEDAFTYDSFTISLNEKFIAKYNTTNDLLDFYQIEGINLTYLRSEELLFEKPADFDYLSIASLVELDNEGNQKLGYIFDPPADVKGKNSLYEITISDHTNIEILDIKSGELSKLDLNDFITEYQGIYISANYIRFLSSNIVLISVKDVIVRNSEGNTGMYVILDLENKSIVTEIPGIDDIENALSSDRKLLIAQNGIFFIYFSNFVDREIEIFDGYYIDISDEKFSGQYFDESYKLDGKFINVSQDSKYFASYNDENRTIYLFQYIDSGYELVRQEVILDEDIINNESYRVTEDGNIVINS